jgi:hypothetical protein
MKRQFLSLAMATMAMAGHSAMASTAYGDLNNFDVVNDTNQPCHGFEIELDGVHSRDITYTFDWNHYGAPVIREDADANGNPRVFVRYESKKDANGAFLAYTAVPAVPLAPTDGHMCTNPAVNEGCEHFGVGYYGVPTTVRYNWLIEDPANPGSLVHGPAVNVATPSWVYNPPVNAQPAQVVAAIQAPPPPAPEVAPPVLAKFGEAVFAKEIKTSSKNNQAVELKDLVSDDPNSPDEKNWLNDKAGDGIDVVAEMEVEWRMMQTEFAKLNDPNNPGGANGQLVAAAEDLPAGDEKITRRYEFFKYAGSAASIDVETGEAMCDKVGADGLHGEGTVGVTRPDPARPGEVTTVQVDCSQEIVVGDYIGAQMAGFDAEAGLGVIDNLQDGEIHQPYPQRTVVVGGNSPYTINVTAGALPAGMDFEQDTNGKHTGVLAGTPTAAGSFAFIVAVTDAANAMVNKAFVLNVVDPNNPLPQSYTLSVAKQGNGSGTVAGNGIACGPTCSVELAVGTPVVLTATADVGSVFNGWSGDCTGTGLCETTMDGIKNVSANFSLQQLALTINKTANGGSIGGTASCALGLATCMANLNYNTQVTLTATPAAGYVFSGWSGACSGTGTCIMTMDSVKNVTATFAPAPSAYTLSVTISGAGSVASSPKGISCSSGTCSTSFKAGTAVTLTAKPARRHTFKNWSGSVCNGSTSATCSVPMTRNQGVAAVFN